MSLLRSKSAWLYRSLTLKTMAWVGLPIIGVSSLAIVTVYFYALHEAEQQLSRELQRHLQDRTRQDSEIFQLAEANQKILKQDLQESLSQELPANAIKQLDSQLSRWSDGTVRNFSQKQDIKTFPARQKSTIFIGPQVQLTDEVKGYIVLFERLATQYGRAFYSRYDNTWINSNQNISVDYRPNTLWGLEALASTDMTQEEYSILATPAKNPTRSSCWTSLYFDPVPGRWMVSLLTPVDYKGKHIGTIGNDIVLNELMDVAIRDTLPKSQNLIFQNDGTLIVHSDRMAEIKASGGKLNLKTIDDLELQRIFQKTQSFSNSGSTSGSTNNQSTQGDFIQIVKDPEGQSFWAITKIKGPNWYWVIVYPQSELARKAIEQILPLIIFGVLGLVLELFLVYRVLRRNVHFPLSKLSAATDSIARGDFNVELETLRPDELGSLARSFASMITQLRSSFSQLATYNATLETQVQNRTEALSNTLTDLELTQAQLVQSEKMSSLGQMVAGIAHEVNNPIGFVHGNLEYAETYIKQLLEHIDLYHQINPVPESIQSHAQSIDLDFLKTDLLKLLASMKMGTDRVKSIVLSLRNFSRIDGIELKVSDLHEGIDSTLLILAHRLKRSPKLPIVIEKHYGNFPQIPCYPGLLNQVFMNLIGNAIDALGNVEEAKITITSCMIDQQVEVTIADNGSGIPEALIPAIFNPFFTTKEIGKGTGLGLSISRQIITERHQGTLSCRSSAQGTAFVITLPIVQSDRID